MRGRISSFWGFSPLRRTRPTLANSFNLSIAPRFGSLLRSICATPFCLPNTTMDAHSEADDGPQQNDDDRNIPPLHGVEDGTGDTDAAAAAADVGGILLPDIALATIIKYGNVATLRAWRSACKETYEIASHDNLWRDRIAAEFPVDASYVLGEQFDALPSVWQRYAAWTRVQRRWGATRLTTAPACRDSRGGSASSSAVVGGSASGGSSDRGRRGLGIGASGRSLSGGAPIFCVATVGDGLFLTAEGRDATLRVVRRRPTAPMDLTAGFRARYTTAAASASALDGGLPNAESLEVVGEWDGGNSGFLGLSVDIGSGTAVGGCFDGSVHAWTINAREFQNLDHLPSKRLRGILAAKGIPFDDINEKVGNVVRSYSFAGVWVCSGLIIVTTGAAGTTGAAARYQRILAVV